jgi:5-methylcytosine-specific restriction endonuclease McrA
VKIRLSRADSEFSRAIKERDNWRCRRCGTQYAEGSRGLHCAHIVGRRNRELRWDERNVVSLCASCHFWAHGNPIAFTDWLRVELGARRLTWLKRIAATPKKVRETACKGESK